MAEFTTVALGRLSLARRTASASLVSRIGGVGALDGSVGSGATSAGVRWVAVPTRSSTSKVSPLQAVVLVAREAACGNGRARAVSASPRKA